MLALEIEFLSGLYRAAVTDGSSAEWPPHPERVFSALAQAWADGGCDSTERAALEWLERLPPPLIQADASKDCPERSAPPVYVPPNDRRGDSMEVLPDRRPRQARSFRARVPVNPSTTLFWPEAPDLGQHLPALTGLARRVACLGHSASLARFAFRQSDPDDQRGLWRPADDGPVALRMMHPGRLRSLEVWFAADRRPTGGMSARYAYSLALEAQDCPRSIFGGVADWFVFEDAGGRRPDLLAFAHVARCGRLALMKYGPQPPPEVLSGHSTQGAATSMPHVAILPLANVGFPYSTGDLLGFAVVLPRGMSGSARQSVLLALAGFAKLDEGQEAYAELRLSKSVAWQVQRSPAPSRASLQPGRWCARSAVWATATPMLLDRFPDHGSVPEEAQLIAASCHNIGLPEPSEIEIHKHSSLSAAPSAYPAGAKASAPDWSFPESAKFANRPRRHAVLRFAQPIEGPVLLGAGRFHGLGLCLPLNNEER